MPDLLRTGIAPILALIKTQLVAIGPATADQIRIAARNPAALPHTMGDTEVILRPRGFSFDRDSVSGAGRIATRVRRRLTVYVRTRLNQDESDRDTQWLDDPALGHFAVEEAVIDALHLFQPADGNNNLLTFEPMRLLPSSEPDKDRDNDGWGFSAVEFEVPYVMALNQSRQ